MGSRAALPRTIVALGFTSLFTDVGTEMVLPLLPAFLATLGAGPAFLALLEGAADATASLLKLLLGRAADRRPARKPYVVLGYALAAATRPWIGAAAQPWQVLGIRLLDRVGKGVRSTPRDLMIAEAAPPGETGRAFGFHNAMDHAGALIGPLLAAALLEQGVPLRTVFFLAAVPGALALIAVLSAQETKPSAAPAPLPAPDERPTALSPPLRRYLLVLGLFALGNSSDVLLLLRAHELGVPVRLAPLLWALLSGSKMIAASLGGRLSDRLPRARLIGIGWVVYALVYAGLAAASSSWQAWLLFTVYGAYHGLTEPVEKALIKDLAPEGTRGRAYGLYNFWSGILALAAGALVGVLWQRFGAAAALGLGAATALCSAALLPLYVFRK